MKKILLSLSLFLSIMSSPSFADECGMKNGKIDYNSSELCKENSAINIQKHVRINDVVNSYVLDGDEASKQAIIDLKEKKYQIQEAALSEAKGGFHKYFYFSFTIVIVVSAFMYLYFKISGEKISLWKMAFSLLLALLMIVPSCTSTTNNKEILSETAMAEFTFVGEKMRMKSTRQFNYTVTKTEADNPNGQDVTVNTPLSRQIRKVNNLVKNYRIMRQTDKIYRLIDRDSDIYYPSKDFIHSTSYGIDFARYKPDNNNEILYSLKPIVFESVNLAKYGNIIDTIGVDNHVTSDVDKLPAVATKLKEELYSHYDKETNNDKQRANNIMADYILLSTNAIRKKFILDTFPKLEEIYQLQLNYSCYNTGDMSKSKFFITSKGKDGVSDCLYMSGGELKIAADGYDANRFNEATDSAIQLQWLAKIKELTTAIAKEAQEIDDKIAKYSIENMSFNNVDFYVDKVNKGGPFEAILYTDKIIYLSQFKRQFTSSVLSSTVTIPVKDVGPAAVDFETLQKDELRGLVSKALNFTVVDKKLEQMFNLKDLDKNSNSVDISNITQAFYEANGNASTTDLVKNIVTNPIKSYFARIGIVDGCFADCEPFTVHPSYALRQTGSEIGVFALTMQATAIGVYAGVNTINKIAAKKDVANAGKADVSNKKKGSNGNAWGTAVSWLTSIVASLAVIPEVISLMETVVVPILEKAPFLLGILHYMVFTAIAPICIVLLAINLVIAKKRESQDYAEVARAFIAIIIISVFESWFIYNLYIYSNSVTGIILWWVSLLANLQMQDASILSQSLTFLILLMVTMTIISVVAVIHFTMINTIYQAIGFEAVHNKSAGSVNNKFDMLIFKLFPWLIMLNTTINSFGLHNDKKDKKDKEEKDATNYNTKNN